MLNIVTTPPDPGDDKNGKGRWTKGTSGNPAGRPRGSRNKSTLLMEELLEDQGEELLKNEIALARKGNRDARRFCLDRIFPVSKERPVEFELPPVEDFQQLAAALSSVLQSVGTGQLTPGAGEQIANLLRLQHDILKYKGVEDRILLLENLLSPELEAARNQEILDAVDDPNVTVDELLTLQARERGTHEPRDVESASGPTREPSEAEKSQE